MAFCTDQTTLKLFLSGLAENWPTRILLGTSVWYVTGIDLFLCSDLGQALAPLSIYIKNKFEP